MSGHDPDDELSLFEEGLGERHALAPAGGEEPRESFVRRESGQGSHPGRL